MSARPQLASDNADGVRTDPRDKSPGLGLCCIKYIRCNAAFRLLWCGYAQGGASSGGPAAATLRASSSSSSSAATCCNIRCHARLE
jgi:hypothetical protein